MEAPTTCSARARFPKEDGGAASARPSHLSRCDARFVRPDFAGDAGTAAAAPSRVGGGSAGEDTRPSLRQAGHSTSVLSTSSNHERPHSQRIWYMRCAWTMLRSSSRTSIPLSASTRQGVATVGGAPAASAEA